MHFWSFILGYIFSWIEELSIIPIIKRWQKQCNYDCSKCKVWDCQYHICQEKKKKEAKKYAKE